MKILPNPPNPPFRRFGVCCGGGVFFCFFGIVCGGFMGVAGSGPISGDLSQNDAKNAFCIMQKNAVFCICKKKSAYADFTAKKSAFVHLRLRMISIYRSRDLISLLVQRTNRDSDRRKKKNPTPHTTAQHTETPV